MVSVHYYTDPACPWSWAAEPCVRKLMVEFGDQLQWTFVMAGMARDWRTPVGIGIEQLRARLVRQWLEAADASGAPLDPIVWWESPLATSYPACMAVKAAAEQAPDGGYRYLRRLREAIMCERRKLDHAEALVEEARGAGLDVERFGVDLRSHAITEAFAADLDAAARLVAAQGGERSSSVRQLRGERCSRTDAGAPLPTIELAGGDAPRQTIIGLQPYDAYRDAALVAGTVAEGDVPSVEQLIARFGRVTSAEVETICELPGPRADAELFRLAEAWRLRPLRKLTGFLWERA